MITNCYIKGRFDFEVGKCAVVIVDDVKLNEPQPILHQAAWKVPSQWEYNGEVIIADQFNCEMLAATYAIQWCMQNSKRLVNIYANTTTCQKWYYRQEFPGTRKAAAIAYVEMVDRYYEELNKEEVIDERIFAEYLPKNDANPFNLLVNQICENLQ